MCRSKLVRQIVFGVVGIVRFMSFEGGRPTTLQTTSTDETNHTHTVTRGIMAAGEFGKCPTLTFN